MRILLTLLMTLGLTACEATSGPSTTEDSAAQTVSIAEESATNFDAQIGLIQCDDSIKLPEGFCAQIFHPGMGSSIRHIAVRDNGDVYVGRRDREGGLYLLRDTDGDGQSDSETRIYKLSGTAVAIHNDHVYFTTPEQVLRFAFNDSSLGVNTTPEIVVTDYEDFRMHASKAIAFDGRGGMFVNVGAPSNTCQQPTRTPGVKGLDPCPLLETTAGVWRFSDSKLGQIPYEDDQHYATGIRNGLAMTWNPQTQALYLLQHGRDQLSELWPDLYTTEQRAELPSEQFFEVQAGDDFGWPYCYFDHRKNTKLLNPEYGGDGTKIGRCHEFEVPIAAYPGHWAPNDVVFYHQTAFPENYHQGAFIAFHGSWNRSPLPQQGYNVVFQPFVEGKASPEYEIFLDTLSQHEGDLRSPGEAKYRPTGLAVDRHGALWVTDSRQGRIWRIINSSAAN